eukprot:3015700-Rhodomonas_salina.1
MDSGDLAFSSHLQMQYGQDQGAHRPPSSGQDSDPLSSALARHFREKASSDSCCVVTKIHSRFATAVYGSTELAPPLPSWTSYAALHTFPLNDPNDHYVCASHLASQLLTRGACHHQAGTLGGQPERPGTFLPAFSPPSALIFLRATSSASSSDAAILSRRCEEAPDFTRNSVLGLCGPSLLRAATQSTLLLAARQLFLLFLALRCLLNSAPAFLTARLLPAHPGAKAKTACDLYRPCAYCVRKGASLLSFSEQFACRLCPNRRTDRVKCGRRSLASDGASR